MMNSKKCTHFVLFFCVAALLLQSCWKDESLKKNGLDDIQMNISPAFGFPLAKITFTGSDIVKQLNMTDSSGQFYVEYDHSQHDLCLLVYDKTNSKLSLPLSAMSFSTTVRFPINYFSDLRIDGINVRSAKINVNVDNEYSEEIHFHVTKLEYEDEDRNVKHVTDNLLDNTNTIKAGLPGNAVRTLLFKEFLEIENPLDIVRRGSFLHLSLDLSYDQLQSGGSLNLNPIIKVPAIFNVEHFNRMDTVKTNLESVKRTFNDTTIALSEISLYLTIENGLPLNADLQVYFVDDKFRLLDSLQGNTMQIRAGELDASTSLLVKPTPASFEIHISKEQFRKIENAQYVIFKEIFNTHNSDDVKLFKSNSFGVILSLKAKAEINGSLSEIIFK